MDLSTCYSLTGEKRQRIPEAALELFIRHGFKRTTMVDIATHADVSRTLLYQSFANKEEVLRACVRDYSERARERAEGRIEKASGLRDKLAAVLWVWSGEVFELARSSSEAKEVLDCTFSFARDEREHALRAFMGQLAGVIRDAPDVDPERLEARGTGPEFLAHFMGCCSDGIEENAGSTAEARRLLGTLTDLVVLMISDAMSEGCSAEP